MGIIFHSIFIGALELECCHATRSQLQVGAAAGRAARPPNPLGLFRSDLWGGHKRLNGGWPDDRALLPPGDVCRALWGRARCLQAALIDMLGGTCQLEHATGQTRCWFTYRLRSQGGCAQANEGLALGCLFCKAECAALRCARCRALCSGTDARPLSRRYTKPRYLMLAAAFILVTPIGVAIGIGAGPPAACVALWISQSGQPGWTTMRSSCPLSLRTPQTMPAAGARRAADAPLGPAPALHRSRGPRPLSTCRRQSLVQRREHGRAGHGGHI